MHRLIACKDLLRCLLSVALIGSSTLPVMAADDNLLAHRLYAAGDFTRAGEIFTDPAWKGVALYRSEQWWRAAEAFVRANDPQSAFNLGNCYVKLGYFELALDAYQQALLLDPALDDAAFNAELMRKLLAEEDDREHQGGRRPSGEAIEHVESQDQDPESSSGEGGDEQGDVGKKAPADESDEPGQQSMGKIEDAQAGKGGQATQQDQQHADDQEGSGAVSGQISDDTPANRPSGGSESAQPSSDSQAAGLRTTLETEQATTQWLNRISHDSRLFLQQRIKLEQRRRLAAGQAAPDGGSSW